MQINFQDKILHIKNSTSSLLTYVLHKSNASSNHSQDSTLSVSNETSIPHILALVNLLPQFPPHYKELIYENAAVFTTPTYNKKIKNIVLLHNHVREITLSDSSYIKTKSNRVFS